MLIPHVLFVEKNFETKQKVVVTLYANGFEALPVSNTNEALALLRVSRFDLVITASHLPDGDADNLIQTMKAAPALSQVPIVVSAQRFTQEEEKHYRTIGASATVALGEDTAEWIRKIRSLVNLHQKETRHTQKGISGQLAQTPISDLIAQLASEEGTGVLYIDGQVPMEIHLVDGQISHARHGITVGFKALCRCLLIAEAAYHFQKTTHGDEVTIKGSLEQLLSSARNANQKLMANSHRLPKSRYRVRIVESNIWENTKLKPEARASLEIIRKYPRIGNYLDRLNLPDVVCYEYLLTFAEKGVIEFVTESKPVQIITDSSCDIPFETLQDLSVITLPVKVQSGKNVFQSFRPREEDKLYAQKAKVLEQCQLLMPDETAIHQRFEALLTDFDCLTITAAASKIPLYNRIVTCADRLHNDGFEGRSLLANELVVLNSHTLSIGLGLVVRYAVNLAKEGLQSEQIEERVLQAIARLHLFFVVNPESSFLVKKGNAPVILGWDGMEITKFMRLNKGVDPVPLLFEEANKRIDAKSRLHLAFGHVHNGSGLEKLSDTFKGKYGMAKPLIASIGPTTGYMLGKGAYGVAFFQE